MAAPGIAGSHETKSSVIRLFLEQPRGVSRPIRLNYKVMIFLFYTNIKLTTTTYVSTLQGSGDILFFPLRLSVGLSLGLSVCMSVCPLQNRVRSIT